MDMIKIVVWDKDPIGKDFLGQCFIPVSVATSHPGSFLFETFFFKTTNNSYFKLENEQTNERTNEQMLQSHCG